MSVPDIKSARMALVDPHAFSSAGSGQRRRAAMTATMREHLGDLWRSATEGARVDGLALGCVGSLARGELGPLSDLDLVLLYRGQDVKSVNAIADKLWYPLWDNGIRFDHSVRTPQQSREAGARDLTAAIGQLDLTWIAGDETLVMAVRSTTAHDWRRDARTRLPELLEALASRHHREGDLAQLVDPDLKEARGGLRDMGILRAMTAAWLADRPHGRVDTAYISLLDARDALHIVTGRPRERLGREDHDAVAAILGDRDGDELLARLAHCGREIAYAVDVTLRRASQARAARTLRISARKPQMTPVGHGLFVHEKEIVLGPAVDAARDPLLPLRAGVVAARSGQTISPTTLTNLADNAPDLPVPWPPAARELFADLLGSGPGLRAVWEGLDLVGLVSRWIPAWTPLRNRPQRSPVHRHTVDRHSVEAVVMAAGLVREVERPDLLLVAALLHDVGKIPEAHDHSVVGASLAERVCVNMGFDARDVVLVTRLVREHLTLVNLATQRDIGDPATVDTLVDAVAGDEETLLLLRALTEADARSVGPAAWTSWRARLVTALFDATRAALRGTRSPAPVDDAAFGDESAAALAHVHTTGSAFVSIRAQGDEYLVRIGDRDRPGLFADLAGWFSAHGFAVRSASLRTVDGVALDEWIVSSGAEVPPDGAALARDVRRLAEGDSAPLRRLARRRESGPSDSSAATSGSPGATRAFIVPSASDTATVIEVRSSDRPRLLFDVGRALTGRGVSIRSAHVATHAGQAVDTFYVTDDLGARLDPATAARVIGTVISACDGA